MPKPIRPVPSRKISETLVEYAEPALDSLPEPAPIADVEAYLKMAAMIWNAVEFAERGERGHLQRVRRMMSRGVGEEARFGKMLFGMMVERKRTRFGSDPRFIENVQVTVDPDGEYYLRAVATLPEDEMNPRGIARVTVPPLAADNPGALASDAPADVIWDRIAWSSTYVPLAEFEVVRRRRSEFEPLMIRSLQEVADDPESFELEAEYHGHEYALLLLAQLRVEAAFPVIVDFLHAIAPYEEGLLGDAISEDLPAVLASTFDGNVGLLKALVEDDGLDEQVRGSGLIAMATLVVNGRIDRPVLSDYLGQVIATVPREMPLFWADVASAILDLRFHEHRRALTGLLDDGVFADDVLDRERIESAFTDESDPREDRCYRLIDDVGAEVNRYPWYGAKASGPEEDLEDDEDADGDDDPERLSEDDEIPDVPYTRTEAKVGRNDPCPCGSGKKYKKCCGK